MGPAATSGRIERARRALLLLLCLSPTLSMFAWAWRDYHARSLTALLLTSALLGVLGVAAARSWRRFFLLAFPLLLLSGAFTGYALAFHMLPGRTLAALIIGTSWEEVRGLLGLAAWHSATLALLAVIVLYLACALTLRNTSGAAPGARGIRRAAILALLPAAAYVATDPAQMIDGLALNPVTGSALFFGGTVPAVAAELHGSRVHKIPYHASREGGEEVHVLVIGESARRASWSAYGYARPTTPTLEQLGTGAVFLTQAVADANLTEWAVPMLLTGMSPDEYDSGTIRGNLVDLAHEAGYSTAWLVNQDISISASVGVSADRLSYPPDLQANINGRHTLDEALLPAYRQEISRTGARFIGIHMMGSHWEYYRRYPPRFQRFGSSQQLGMLSVFLAGRDVEASVVDAYDNTVLYTDWFLGQLIEGASALTVPSTVTFFPDHGEGLQRLDGSSGHGAPEYTAAAFEIPAFVWMNEAYQRQYPERVAALRANAAREIRTHDLFDSEAMLMGIHWSGERPTRSFVSDRFVPDVSMQHIAGGVRVERH